MPRIRAIAANRNDLFRTLAAASLWIALHVYAARPLLALAPRGAWIAVLLMPFVSILPFFARRDTSLRSRSLAHWAGYLSLSLFSMLLVVVLLSDTLRLGWMLFGFAPLHTRTMSGATLAAAVVLGVIGFAQARRPRVVRLPIDIDNLPDELDGYRIVQWSDVHAGPTIQRGFLACLVARTNELRADAVVITGDLIDGALDELRDHVQPLRGLRARDGVFFVTGNHEYYWRFSEWQRELAKLGLVFLKNEHRVVRGQLVIAGVTDPAGQKPDVRAALAGAPAGAVKVLLAHRPQAADAAGRNGVDLQLSGHTHGGQFFPFNLLIRWFQPVVRGLHRVGAKTQLYVSRGTGYWGPPSRLGVGGEITVLELRGSSRTDSAAGGPSPAGRAAAAPTPPAS
jgi:hypothetical protein